MKIHEIPIIVLVIALLVIGIVSFVTDLGTNYNRTASTGTINEIGNKFSNMTGQANTLKDDVIAFIPERGNIGDFLDLPWKFIKTGIQIVKTFFVAAITLGGITETIGKALAELGVPFAGEIISAAIAIIIIVVVAIIGYALYKWKAED